MQGTCCWRGGMSLRDGEVGVCVLYLFCFDGSWSVCVCVCVCVYTHIQIHTACRVLLDESRGVGTRHLRPESPKNSR